VGVGVVATGDSRGVAAKTSGAAAVAEGDSLGGSVAVPAPGGTGAGDGVGSATSWSPYFLRNLYKAMRET
jgi:hypothetical protein